MSDTESIKRLFDSFAPKELVFFPEKIQVLFKDKNLTKLEYTDGKVQIFWKSDLTWKLDDYDRFTTHSVYVNGKLVDERIDY